MSARYDEHQGHAVKDISLRRGGKIVTLLILLPLLLGLDLNSAGQDAADQDGGQQQAAVEAPAEEEQIRHAYHVLVPLPIVGSVDLTVREQVERALEQLPAEQPRPVLVLEFRSTNDQSGIASQFERSLSLARFLGSDTLNRVRTVAFLPASVKGHAVLPVIACEEVIMHPDAELGAAGIQERFIDQTVRSGYEEIATRRRTMPKPLVLGMLDPSLAVYRVRTLEGTRYVLEDELRELEQAAKVSVKETVVSPEDYGVFTGRQLRLEHSVVSHLAKDLDEVARELKLPPGSLSDQLPAGAWKAVQAELRGPVNSKSVSWLISSLEQQCADGEVNFVCLIVDSPGGSPEESIRLAQWLADQDRRRIRTVAFIPRQARGDASMIALGCDELVLGRTARLGGPGAAIISQAQIDALRPAIEAAAQRKQREWSVYAGLIDPKLQVRRYSRDGGNRIRYLCGDEYADLPDKELWEQGPPVDLGGGINSQEAIEYRLSKLEADSMDELQSHFGLQDRPARLERNWAHEFVERLSSPGLARTLLFFAFFSLMIELMHPGLSVAGFISSVCFLLFFWSQFLHGTAGWLEIMLFAGGVVCVLMEIFVVPGLGAFGIGGAGMIIASIVLASQTFVIPRNAYQLQQLPGSLSTVIAAFAGMIVSIVLMRRFLPHTPFFRNVVLQPPDEETRAAIDSRERLAHYDHLLGKRGVATTQLTPSGKARFGDDVINVICQGELIPRETAVYVVETRGNHVIVARVES